MNSTQNYPDDKPHGSETNSKLPHLSSQNPNSAINTPTHTPRQSARNNHAGVAINALSRVLAVMVIGAAVAGLGALVDSWLETNYWTLVGVIAGMILAIPGLFLVAKVSELDAKRMSAEDRMAAQDRATSPSPVNHSPVNHSPVNHSGDNSSGDNSSGGSHELRSAGNTSESAQTKAPSNPQKDQ